MSDIVNKIGEEIVTPWSSIGLLTYKRTYSRKLKDNDYTVEGPTEDFPDTIERVLKSCDTQLHVGFTENERARLRKYFLKLQASVAGRFLWQCGTQTVDRLGLASLQNCAFTVVDNPIVSFSWCMDLLALGAGVGFNIQREHVNKIPPVKPWFKAPTRVDDGGADFIIPDSRAGWVRFLAKTLKAAFLSERPEKGTFTYSTQAIRGKGTPIKGFGGIASGPADLVWGIGKISEVLTKRLDRKLRPIDCLDIMNIIGAIIIAGNVRRSAQICLFDPDDIEVLLAKRWDIGKIPSWRAMSNNTVVCNDLKDLHEYFWDSYETGGEPLGLLNLALSRKIGRLGETQYPDPNIQGCNPCSEQSLEPFETCCLSEIFLPNVTSKEELIDIAKLLYRINKHSLNLPCHHPETEAVVHKNMRMGIGLTGILQCSKEKISWLNECYEELREYDVRYSQLHGFNRSIKLTTIKPSGCSVGSTLLVTASGILTLDEIGNVEGEQWQDHYLSIQQESGYTRSTKFYINGKAATKLITLDSGIELESTLTHKYRTLSDIGDYNWIAVADLKVGDKLPYRVGGYEGTTYRTLKKVTEFGKRSVVISQPEVLDEELAYILGVYLADGSTHLKGIRIAGDIDTKAENLEAIKEGVFSIFGLEGRLCARPGTKNLDLYLTSQALLRWFELNDLIKAKSHEITIPLIIRKSPKSVIESYINGFFSGDGHQNKDVMTFCTTSKVFSQQLTILMRAIGIDAKVKDMPPTSSSLGKRMRYWISERKGRNAEERYIKRELRRDWEQLDKLGLKAFSVDSVVSIVDSENITYDIEVPENNTYIANSYVSHNTLSLLPGVVPGIHPGYAQYMYRRIRIASEHPLVEICKNHGYPCEFQRNFDGTEDYGTVVVTFPFSYPEGTVLAKDMTALDQLKQVKRMQTLWSDNAVSCTIYYTKDELPAIKEHLNKHYKDTYKGLSFLLHSEHNFQQAPYQAISKEKYDELVAATHPITAVSNAEFEGADECLTGACPVR